jgi:ATP-binding cassette subfamily B multidrug efflux pump
MVARISRLEKMNRTSILREYFYRHRVLLTIGIIAIVIISVLEVLLPMIIKAAIDNLSASPDIHKLSQIALSYLAVAAALCLMRATWRVCMARSSASVGYLLRERYLSHLLRLPKSFFNDRKTGELTALGNSDIESVRNMFDIGTVTIVDAICGLIVPPIAMFYLNSTLAVILLAPLLGIPIMTYFFDRRIHRFYHAAQGGISQLYAHMQESLEGIMVIKSFTKEHSMLKRFDLTSKAYIKKSLMLSKSEALFGPTLDFFVALSLLIHIIYGGQLVIKDVITLGTFVAFIRYLQMLAWPMKAVGLAVTLTQKALVSSERLQGVLLHNTESESGMSVSKEEETLLRFENVSFHYPGTVKNVLKEISFEVKPGEKIAILGDVGCGKSTLLSLIPGIYDPSSGKVLVKELETDRWNKHKLRSEISFVPQDVFLFNRSIKDNIAFGSENAAVEKIEEAAGYSAIINEIRAMSEGIYTILGERGINISGGQKQRLSIARALLKNSPILIFDDALSAVDLESEKQIVESLQSNLKNRTVIFCGQRLSGVKNVDKVIVLKNGEIIQQGRPAELLSEKGGWFYNFCEEQQIEEELNEQPA